MSKTSMILSNPVKLFVFLILILLLLPIDQVTSQVDDTVCSIAHGNYSSTSTYLSNLKIVLRTLTLRASEGELSFYNTSSGDEEDVVYGLYLCRGDVAPKNCSVCVGRVIKQMIQDCPNAKEVIRWDYECMLRYANRNISSKTEESPVYIQIITPMSASTPFQSANQFNRTKVIYDLINQTAFGYYSSSTRPFFATRADNVTSSWFPEMHYSLAQCTPDISSDLCYRCLTHAFDLQLRSCCPGEFEANIFLPSCNLRSSIYKFFSSNNSTIRRKSPDPTNLHPPTSSPQLTGQVENRNKNGRSLYIAMAIAIPSVGALVLLFGFCYLWKRWDSKLASNDSSDIITIESLQYDATEINAATNNFTLVNKLGNNIVSPIYKGKLRNGQEIAVKRLSRTTQQSIEDLKKNVHLVAKLQHKNLIRLLGYCLAYDEKLLIYEFMPNSSLDEYLFNSEKQLSLTWEMRYNIIKGIAKGMLYLHDYCQPKIVHRGLTPRNILLDKDMSAKISTFGIAELFVDEELECISQRMSETCSGHIAPESMRCGEFTSESDVYSFGVLLLQILSGKRVGYKFGPDQSEEDLLQFALRLWSSEEPLKFIDPALKGNFSANEATQCNHIALLCINRKARKRPAMANIVSMLNSQWSILPELPSEDYYNSSDNSISFRGPELDWSSTTYSGLEDITTLSAR